MATAPSLNSLADSVQQSLSGDMREMSSLFSQISGAQRGQAELAKSTGDAASLVESTQQLGEARAQAQALDYATKLGTNPEASTEQLSKLISDKQTLFETARANLRDVARKQKTSLFADPLQWIADQFTLDRNVQNYNAAAEEYNLVGKRVDDLVSSTGELAKMTNAIAVTKTNASAKAAADVARAKFDLMAGQANIDALKTNADGIAQITQMRQTQLNNAFKVRDQQLQEQSLALSRQNAALHAKSLEMQLADKAEATQSKKEMLDAVNLYRVSNGMPELNRTAFELLARSEKDKDMIQQQIIGGFTIAEQKRNGSRDVRYLADSPYNAAKLAGAQGAQLDTPRASLINLTQQVASQLQADPQVAGKLKTEKQFEEAINSAVTKKAADMAANSSGIYAPPSLQTLLGDRTIASTPSAQLVLAPLATSGVNEFKPSIVIPQILEQVKQKKIPMDQAIKDIEFIANKAIAYNNNSYAYKSTMGLPDQKALPVQLEVTQTVAGVIGGSAIGSNFAALTGDFGIGPSRYETVDISNPAQLQNYVNRYMSGSIAASFKQQAASASKTK